MNFLSYKKKIFYFAYFLKNDNDEEVNNKYGLSILNLFEMFLFLPLFIVGYMPIYKLLNHYDNVSKLMFYIAAILSCFIIYKINYWLFLKDNKYKTWLKAHEYFLNFSKLKKNIIYFLGSFILIVYVNLSLITIAILFSSK